TVKERALPSPLLWSGIVFRTRLVMNRLRRHWQYILMAAVALFLLYQAEYHLQHQSPPISIWSFITYLFQLADDRATPIEQPLTTLTGVLAAYSVLSRLLVGFGSNPATLLSTVSGKSRPKDLEAQ